MSRGQTDPVWPSKTNEAARERNGLVERKLRRRKKSSEQRGLPQSRKRGARGTVVSAATKAETPNKNITVATAETRGTWGWKEGTESEKMRKSRRRKEKENSSMEVRRHGGDER